LKHKKKIMGIKINQNSIVNTLNLPKFTPASKY
jgi:hypothetical protein